jgi:TonB family protein
LPSRARGAQWSALIVLGLHASAALALSLVALSVRSSPAHIEPTTPSDVMELPRMVFLQAPGPGGGGGGGGNRQAAPPSRAQAIGRDRITLNAARPIVAQPEPAPAVSTIPSIAIPAMPLASGAAYQIGLPEASASLAFSQGAGSGGGAGTGSGAGIGPGSGPGFGPGTGGGFGGGAFRPGNGVTVPVLLRQVRPNYTSEAMQRKIQGTVVLEVVVGADGIPVDHRVLRSLDPNGLDNEAVQAVRQWRFAPGQRGDTPVPVLVNIVIDFHIR